MKANIIIPLVAVLLLCALPNSAVGQAVIFNYTIHVDFFAYSCSLSVGQVLLYDTSGNLVGTGSSPTGGEVAILVRTASPILTLTARAYGVATWSSYYNWLVNGSRTITLGGSGDYWITINMT